MTDAQELLVRSQLAMTAVLDSTVRREKWLDTQRNEAVFPRQEWVIAHDRRSYRRVARKGQRAPHTADNAKLAGLLTSRGRVLATSLHGIERRVEALEAYASQVAEADARSARYGRSSGWRRAATSFSTSLPAPRRTTWRSPRSMC